MKTNDTLKSLRAAKGLTQAEVAAELGVSLSSYQKYERDKNSVVPSLEVLERISDYYGVSIDYLLGRVPEDDYVLNALSAEFNMNELEKRITKNYLSLPPKMREALMNLLMAMVETESADSDDSTSPNKPD